MNWDWFYSLYYIAVVVTIISFLWRFAVIPLMLFAAIFNPFIQRFVIFIIYLIPQYFIVSYTVLIAQLVSDDDRPILLFILGGLFVIMNEFISVGNVTRDAERNFDYESTKLLNLRMWGLPLTISYYIYSCFNPHLAINEATYWMAEIISKIHNIPFIEWIIAFIAFIYTIYVIGIFTLMVFQLVGSIVARKQREKQETKHDEEALPSYDQQSMW